MKKIMLIYALVISLSSFGQKGKAFEWVGCLYDTSGPIYMQSAMGWSADWVMPSKYYLAAIPKNSDTLYVVSKVLISASATVNYIKVGNRVFVSIAPSQRNKSSQSNKNKR
jgi:hypothetical protein